VSNPPPATSETVKDTLIAILIAFMLAFIARVFVCEPFVIPTGSMAPTLLGAHMRVQSPQSGRAWSAGPRSYLMGENGRTDFDQPAPIQRATPPSEPMVFHDPHTGEALSYPELPARAGDRIFVLKYIYALREPTRYDVVVFKDPGDPTRNFIKRLIALPGEQIALVDGDVFTRPARVDGEPTPLCWEEAGWQIRRKPIRVQRAVWQSVYDTQSVPIEPSKLNFAFVSPLQPRGEAKLLDGGRSFVCDQQGSIVFDPAMSEGVDAWAELSDRNPYNEGTYPQRRYVYPVSDLRVRVSVEPTGDVGACRVAPTIVARGHEFRAVFQGSRVSIEMRGQPTARSPETPWNTLKSMDFAGFATGRATSVELWHFDQSLHVFVDDREIGTGVEYDWNPSQRIFAATGMTLSDFASADLANPVHYRKPEVRIDLSAARVRRVTLDRDLHYQPGDGGSGNDLRACKPTTSIALGSDQFFVCGDNSSASSDSRAWTSVDPWVASQLDATPGVVPRRLLLGRAFFVYLPAMAGDSPAPVPDFGRMRFIQ
jgi:signal peptidase I